MKVNLSNPIPRAIAITTAALASVACGNTGPYQAEIDLGGADYIQATTLFTGPGTSTPLLPIVADDHPVMAARGHNSMHSDSSMSDTHPETGPTGESSSFKIGSAKMNTSILGGGECGNTTFTSTGLLISFCADFNNFKVYALQPLVDDKGNERFRKVAEYALPERESSLEAKSTFPIDVGLIMNDTSGGAYFRLDNQDRVIIVDASNTLQILELSTQYNAQGYLGGSFTPVLSAEIGFHDANDTDYQNPNHHDVTDVIPDWNVPDVYWWVTRQGKVGTIDLSGQVSEVHSLNLSGEEIQNATAMDATGLYVVSDHAMYKYTLDVDNSPSQLWRVVYDRGTQPKPGQLNQGSGTTPTLLGSDNDYVAITDNRDPIYILVYDRDSGNIICEEPVFQIPVGANDTSGLQYASATDNSLIGYNNTMMVENNWGYSGPLDNNWTKPGFTRVDIIDNTTPGDLAGNCVTTWENTTVASQSTVPKLSLGSGLIYIYTREDIPGNASDPFDGIDDQAYYFGALDYKTGELVFKVLTGASKNWNNNYAPITIGPDGTAYVGTFNGIISIKDN